MGSWGEDRADHYAATVGRGDDDELGERQGEGEESGQHAPSVR